mgnify:FL=1
MITTKTISTWDQFLVLLVDQSYDDSIDRYRSKYLYRGIPDESYHLKTSLQRNCKEKKDIIESSILRNFTKYASFEDPQLNQSVWRQLIIGQHHGLPTRLLDWTHSHLVALHFATKDSNLSEMENHNCVVWRINLEEFNSLLPQKYQETLEKYKAYFFTLDMLAATVNSLDVYDQDMDQNSIVLLEPPSIDQRIINQYSYFSIIPRNINEIEEFLDQKTNQTVKYIISKDLRWRIRDMLDQMNMNERTMFPGLDGICSWLSRHYYVK